MIVAQDLFRQKPRKICKSQHCVKEDKTKQLNTDTKDHWLIEYIKEEGQSESGNDSGDENIKKIHYKDERRRCFQRKNVRFECSSGEYMNPESEYSENERCCQMTDKSEHYCHVCEVAECRKPNVRAPKPVRKLEDCRLLPKYHSKNCSDYVGVRPTWDSDDKMHRCGEWCNRHQAEEPRNEIKSPLMFMYSKPYKNVHKKGKLNENQECSYHQQKKKVLDSYEELPAVDESLEHRSDATYKASSYTKFSQCDSQTQEKTNDKVFPRSPSWIMCDKMVETALNEANEYNPERTTKTRSRRTKITRRRGIKWTKALIHPVVEGSRKEKVGVMILGQNGPEFYSKYSLKKSCIPFRKTRSFPEGPTKSYDMPFNEESKEIFFSGSEPGRKPKIPQEDAKIEEKISDFDKNMNNLGKNTEEEILEALSKDPDDTKEEEEKKNLSVKMPKIFAFNVDSKMMAESLNGRGKQFKQGYQPKASDLEKEFQSHPLEKEKREANLPLWGMEEQQKMGGEGDGTDLNLRITLRGSDCSGREEKADEDSEKKDVSPKKRTKEEILFEMFKNLVKDRRVVSEKESESLRKIFANNEATSSATTSSETVREKEEGSYRKKGSHECSDVTSRKTSERKWKGVKTKKRKLKVEKLKMIRDALPSMTAENEAAHLNQLKKYIRRFIEGVEQKISTPSDMKTLKHKPSTSSESSEIRVDARKLIDLVSHPFKRITSDMTIDMAKKLTDALVQETESKKNVSKARKNSEGSGEGSIQGPTTSGSDRDDEIEPKYLDGLKKMRNDHLNNILMEVRRLRELIRFLDRCNRLKP